MKKINLKNEERFRKQVQVGTYLTDYAGLNIYGDEEELNIDEVVFIDDLSDAEFYKLSYLLLYYDYEEAVNKLDDCFYYCSEEELIQNEGCYALNDLCDTQIMTAEFYNLYDAGVINTKNIISHISSVHRLYEINNGEYLLIYN